MISNTNNSLIRGSAINKPFVQCIISGSPTRILIK